MTASKATAKRPKRKAKRKIKIALARTDGKHSAVDIAKMVRQLDDDWRTLASDAVKALHDVAESCGVATMVDVREKAKRRYWALKAKLDALSGQLEMFS